LTSSDKPKEEVANAIMGLKKVAVEAVAMIGKQLVYQRELKFIQ
jgi:hypothetical protein